MNILSNVAAGDFRNCVSPVPLRHFYAISAFAETYRNRLAFDEVMLRNQMLGNSIADVVHYASGTICSNICSVFVDFNSFL